MEEEKKNSKKKVLAISIISIVVVLVIGGVVFYVAQNDNKNVVTVDNEPEILGMQERYNKLNGEIELLILSEEEQNQINTDLATIKNAIEEKNITDTTKSIVDKLEQKVEEIKNSNISVLTEKENELTAISIEKFNEEQKAKSTELQTAYNNLKNEGKYKEAKAKIEELIQYNNTTNEEISKAEETAKKNQSTTNRKPSSQSSQTSSQQTTTQTQPSQTTQPSTPTPEPEPEQPAQPTTPNEPEQPTTPSEPVQPEPTPEPEPEPTPTKPTSLQVSFNPTYSVIDRGDSYRVDYSGVITNNANWNLSLVCVRIYVYCDGIQVGSSIRAVHNLTAGGSGMVSGLIMIDKDIVPHSNFTYSFNYSSFSYE